jgi:Tfp pilus assembly protein FimT
MTLCHLRRENGFTLMELLVASTMTVVVLGGAVALTSQIQSGYRRQIEDSAGEQEARYALEWIGRYLRAMGNSPLPANDPSQCPAAGTAFTPLVMGSSSITLQSDSNPKDGLIGGVTGACTQTGEHVTISYNATDRAITFQDVAVGSAATSRTDAVIQGLQFVYLDSGRAVTASPGAVFYVQTRITIRSRTINPGTGLPATRVLMSETRVRGR